MPLVLAPELAFGALLGADRSSNRAKRLSSPVAVDRQPLPHASTRQIEPRNTRQPREFPLAPTNRQRERLLPQALRATRSSATQPTPCRLRERLAPMARRTARTYPFGQLRRVRPI